MFAPKGFRKMSPIENLDQNSGNLSGGYDTLLSAANRLSSGKRGPAPVHLWNPPFCGDIDMRIARDGVWFYNGSPIGRLPLVQLFSNILRRDGEDYVLVTPVEKVGIRVDDAPFLIIRMHIDTQNGQSITLTTQTEEDVVVGPDHPLRFEREAGDGLKPYVLVRDNLWALVKRALFYDLVALGETREIDGVAMFGIVSQGAFFAIDAGFLADFLDRVEKRLPNHCPVQAGDHRLNKTEVDPALMLEAKPAAVLIPVVHGQGAPQVLLTQRSAHLRNHSGQIAFPGGRIELNESPQDAALRETHEEIGLAPHHVELIGTLQPYLSGTGYLIHPIVGLIAPQAELSLNHDEVSDTFEVPLAFIMDKANHQVHSRIWNGKERYFYAIPYQERYIWGVTAGIIRALYEGLYL
eukprot:gene13461-13576_t